MVRHSGSRRSVCRICMGGCENYQLSSGGDFWQWRTERKCNYPKNWDSSNRRRTGGESSTNDASSRGDRHLGIPKHLSPWLSVMVCSISIMLVKCFINSYRKFGFWASWWQMSLRQWHLSETAILSFALWWYALLIDIRGIARSVGVIDLAEELTYQCETMLWVVFVGATGVGPKV